MAQDLADLRTVPTEEQVTTSILTNLDSLGFSSTAWQSGQPNLVMVQAFARDDSSRAEAVKIISESAFNELAVGNALTEFSFSHYDNARQAAVSSQHTVRLTAAAGAGPFTPAIGDLVAQDQNSDATFRNITDGTLGLGPSTLDLVFDAEVAGEAGNIAPGTMTILQTPLAGVTISNTSIDKQGSNTETDAALRLRNKTKWAVRSDSDPADRYANFVLTAVPSVERVEVDNSNPQGPGTVDVYIAGPTGVSVGADVTAAQTEMDRVRNPTAKVTVFAAPAQVQDFTYTAFIAAVNNTPATQSAIEQALRDYVNGIDIGGTIFPPASTGSFIFSEAIGAMTLLTGVVGITMTTPVGDVPIAIHQIMTVGAVTATHTSV